MKARAATPLKKKAKYDGDFSSVISTGSTLLDLAISGGRVHGGGIPPENWLKFLGPQVLEKQPFFVKLLEGFIVLAHKSNFRIQSLA